MFRSLALAALLTANAGASVTLTLRPSSSTANSGDAYLASANPTANFGSSGALVVSGSGSANTKGAFASVLKFDLSAITTELNATVGVGLWQWQSVSLQLTAAIPQNSSFNANAAGGIHVHWLQEDGWTENGVTWNQQTALVSAGTESLGTLAYSGASSGTATYALTPSAGFLNDLNNGGIASLHLTAADPDVSMVIHARNFGTAANRPALILTATPEPSRAVLLGMGSLALIMRRRR